MLDLPDRKHADAADDGDGNHAYKSPPGRRRIDFALRVTRESHEFCPGDEFIVPLLESDAACEATSS
jgi:hypothetical protein